GAASALRGFRSRSSAALALLANVRSESLLHRRLQSPQRAPSPHSALSPQIAASPQRALSPQSALSPHNAVSPHSAVSPHTAVSPQRALSPHSAELPWTVNCPCALWRSMVGEVASWVAFTLCCRAAGTSSRPAPREYGL